MDFLNGMTDEPVTRHRPPNKKLGFQVGANLLGVPPSTYRLWAHNAGGKFSTLADAVVWISGNVEYVLRPTDEAWKTMVETVGEVEALRMCGGKRVDPSAPKVPKHLQARLDNPAGHAARRRSTDEDDDEANDSQGEEDITDLSPEELAELVDDTTIEGRIARTRRLERKIFMLSLRRPDPKLLSAYRAICALGMELDKDLLEVAKVRDSLVPIDVVVGAASLAVSVVLAEIRALPEAAALRVNPVHPAMAKEELDAIVATLVASAQAQVSAQLSELLKLTASE